MSWLIIGTLPYENFQLLDVEARIEKGGLRLGSEYLSVVRGTAALAATACIAAETIGIEPPRILVAGDIGRGDGSGKVYEHLVRTLPDRSENLLVFHYLQPDVDWHNRILMGIQDKKESPLMVADAGYMYVAKMSGFASSYDLFTPDIGELAFLADDAAPHPFYTRGFILQEPDRVEELIRMAYRHENSARFLLVKGPCDMVASCEGIIEKICEPNVETMEPIGGTGDSLTGIVSALIASGRSIPDSAAAAAKINRTLGSLFNPIPANSISDLLPVLPQAISKILGHPAG